MSPSLTQCEAREAQFAAEVDGLARSGDSDSRRALLAFCDERHAAYEDQPGPAVARMRGWVLEALCRAGSLPDEALPFVLEELETAHDAYLLAVAAWCLRRYREPLASFSEALSLASRNAPGMEAPVMLGVYGGAGPAGGGNTSPKRELAATLEWMGPQAGGCCPELPASIVGLFRGKAARPTLRAVERVALEDHRGQVRTYRQRFRGQPSIVVFFYSRCDNPYKCTLTLSKMSRVQRILEERGLLERIGTAAITYDPAYDTPERLQRYGRNRGFRVDCEGHVLLRASEGFDVLRRHFELGVSFFAALVSRHRIEVFVLDCEGRVAYTFTRLNWSEERAVEEAVGLLADGAATVRERLAGFGERPTVPLGRGSDRGSVARGGVILGIAASLVPKCPMCWATYLSFLGVSGTLPIIGAAGLKAAAAVLLTLHVALALWRVRTRGWHSADALSLLGAAVIAVNVANPMAGLAASGVALMLIASVLTVRREYAR